MVRFNGQGVARTQERWKSYACQMETIVSSNDFLQLKSSSLVYGKSLLPHWVNSLECYYFYYAHALCKLMGGIWILFCHQLKNVLSGSTNDQCAYMCASSRRQSFFIHPRAADNLWARVYKGGVHCHLLTGGWGVGGQSDGMKKYKWWVRR